jgi:hypothetical protein
MIREVLGERMPDKLRREVDLGVMQQRINVRKSQSKAGRQPSCRFMCIWNQYVVCTFGGMARISPRQLTFTISSTVVSRYLNVQRAIKAGQNASA